ncbi:MAG TPA: response regulator, partial [Polyangiaceae bacterium]|nr:response regulator [Polyangiaceae bacterium]
MSRILIVDDDPAQTRLLARSFARRRPDLTILTSANGVEAVRLLVERPVDLIITDLLMPELDGFELLAWVAKHCPEVPVFVMSGSSAADSSARVNELGAVAYFSKPLDVKAVLARLTDELSQTVRGHVQNVSLASFLQLMEMERKTCTLSVSCAESSGTLVIRKGELIAAETAGVRGAQAAIAIIAWPNPSITISSPLAAE